MFCPTNSAPCKLTCVRFGRELRALVSGGAARRRRRSPQPVAPRRCDHDEAADRGEIVAKLDYDPDLFILAERAGRVVGSVMGTYDGHRGRVKRCVIDPDQQGTGLGRKLMHELERRFLDRGITELRLEVWAENEGGFAFWSSLGWEHLEDIRYFTRSLR